MLRRIGCLGIVAVVLALMVMSVAPRGLEADRTSESVVLQGRTTGESWFQNFTIWRGDVTEYEGVISVDFAIAPLVNVNSDGDGDGTFGGIVWGWTCNNRVGARGAASPGWVANSYYRVYTGVTGSAGIFIDDAMEHCTFSVWVADADEQAFKINGAAVYATRVDPVVHPSDPPDPTPTPAPSLPPAGLECLATHTGGSGDVRVGVTRGGQPCYFYAGDVAFILAQSQSVPSGDYCRSHIVAPPGEGQGITGPGAISWNLDGNGTGLRTYNSGNFTVTTTGTGARGNPGMQYWKSAGSCTVAWTLVDPGPQNPLSGDTDGDTYSNFDETVAGSDPNSSSSVPPGANPTPTPPPPTPSEVPQPQDPDQNDMAEFCRTNPTAGLCQSIEDIGEFCEGNPQAGACVTVTPYPTLGPVSTFQPSASGHPLGTTLLPTGPGGPGGAGLTNCERQPPHEKAFFIPYSNALATAPDLNARMAGKDPIAAVGEMFTWTVDVLEEMVIGAVTLPFVWAWNTVVVDAFIPSNDCMQAILNGHWTEVGAREPWASIVFLSSVVNGGIGPAGGFAWPATVTIVGQEVNLPIQAALDGIAYLRPMFVAFVTLAGVRGVVSIIVGSFGVKRAEPPSG